MIKVFLIILVKVSFVYANDFDPIMKFRCDQLKEDKSKQEKLKGRLEKLIVRNKTLKINTPIHKKSVLKKLKHNLFGLESKLYYIKKAINSLHTEIIKKGCPGLGEFPKEYIFNASDLKSRSQSEFYELMP